MDNDQDMVIICRKHIPTGYESQLIYPVTRKVGELRVKRLNKQHPNLRHWLRPYTKEAVQEKTE